VERESRLVVSRPIRQVPDQCNQSSPASGQIELLEVDAHVVGHVGDDETTRARRNVDGLDASPADPDEIVPAVAADSALDIAAQALLGFGDQAEPGSGRCRCAEARGGACAVLPGAERGCRSDREPDRGRGRQRRPPLLHELPDAVSGTRRPR
jgi:hypothetical protein